MGAIFSLQREGYVSTTIPFSQKFLRSLLYLLSSCALPPKPLIFFYKRLCSRNPAQLRDYAVTVTVGKLAISRPEQGRIGLEQDVAHIRITFMDWPKWHKF